MSPAALVRARDLHREAGKQEPKSILPVIPSGCAYGTSRSISEWKSTWILHFRLSFTALQATKANQDVRAEEAWELFAGCLEKALAPMHRMGLMPQILLLMKSMLCLVVNFTFYF